MILLFQLLFVLFALSAIVQIYKKYVGHHLGVKGTAFWMLFWIASIIAVIWPSSTAMLASVFGIGRGADFVIYIAIALLFFVAFTLHIKIESLSKDLTRLVRKQAIDDQHNHSA